VLQGVISREPLTTHAPRSPRNQARQARLSSIDEGIASFHVSSNKPSPNKEK
jgi:hypothetical protein